MKKVGDLMREMGFNKDASPSSQKAFLKYLSRHAGQTAPARCAGAASQAGNSPQEPVAEPEQLNFPIAIGD